MIIISFYHNGTDKFEEMISKIEKSESDIIVLGGDINSDPREYRGKVYGFKSYLYSIHLGNILP